MSLYEWIVIGLMLAFNAVFAAFEMALASLSLARLQLLVSKNKTGAAAAMHMKQHMESSLAVVQLGITLVGAIAAATGGAAIDDSLAPVLQSFFNLSPRSAEMAALILFVIPLSALTIVFAELVPKIFAIQNKEFVCLTLAPYMDMLARALHPIVAVFDAVTKAIMRKSQKFLKKVDRENIESLQELRAAVSLARTSLIIGAREERILLSASQFSFRSIKEIMIPTTEITMMPLGIPLSDALIRAHLDMHTRFPVCLEENDPQTIQGYVTFKDLVVTLKMNPTAPSLKSILRPLKHFREDASIGHVLEFMIHEKVHISLVESRAGKILGMVTMEDIIEELVGDIEDEFDRIPSHVHPTGAGWIVGGGVHMDFLAQVMGIPEPLPLDGKKSPTLAEWCVRILGRSVDKGEILKAGGITVNARKLRRKKLAEAFVTIDKAAG